MCSSYDIPVTVVDSADVQWLVANLWDHYCITIRDMYTNKRVLVSRGLVKMPKMMPLSAFLLSNYLVMALTGDLKMSSPWSQEGQRAMP